MEIPDGRLVYFESPAWASSEALHSRDSTGITLRDFQSNQWLHDRQQRRMELDREGGPVKVGWF
jgi:hypothetical protein